MSEAKIGKDHGLLLVGGGNGQEIAVATMQNMYMSSNISSFNVSGSRGRKSRLLLMNFLGTAVW